MGDFPDNRGAHAHRLGTLIEEFVGAEGIPLPGHGQTLARWRLFATIAAERGAVAIKLFEAHADALAILAEVADATPAPDTRWAIWAAEPPDARLRVRTTDSPDLRRLAQQAGLTATDRFTPARLTGRKAWCSGAGEVSHALVTGWLDQAEPGAQRLAVVDMASPGIRVTREGWHAVGMAATDSGDVLFDDCPALLLTAPDAYLRRPGFWHGGAGIAACWHGAALPLANAVAHAVRAALKKRDDPHAAAHLAAIDGDLHASAALLRETARWIDDHPTEDAFVPAMRARTVIEAAVLRVIQHAGNTLGAGPLCRNPTLAALYADLPVLLRQSHAERDLAALGQRLAQGDSDVGTL
ncbi:acyl-CoA dehydrogenase [Cupriavidus sp. 2KB_3]|uniref:acyl-CoA dehydrogenase family protein n=1 Tax=Cupriavidus TaxID=106589 RepID=UPI0021CCCE97|nr:acyl-CoA dehydrogenase family protein [Cupriavidus campinensis]